MTALAFSIGALFAVLGIVLVLSHKDEVPFLVRAVSFILGVIPGCVGARLALSHQLPLSFLCNAVAFLFLLFAFRLIAREHRREVCGKSERVTGRTA